MQILIPDIVDTALISGVISVFLIADILIKNYLKIDQRDVGADLAIGALVIQLGFIATLLIDQQMDHFWNNIVLAICFSFFWFICLWLTAKKDPLTDMFSYTIGTFALAASIMHFLGTFKATGMTLLLVYSFILSVLAFLLADYLRTEAVKSDFEKLVKDLQIYDMNESYRKLEAGKENIDPLQPVIDVIRGAIRNNNDFVATIGLKEIPKLCYKVLASGGNKNLIIKYFNKHLYQLAILAEDEKDRFVLMEVIDAFGSIGKQSAMADMEIFTLQTIDMMNGFFDMHREKEDFRQPDRMTLIRRSKGPGDLANIARKKVIATPLHKLAIATGDIGTTSAKKEMLEPTEKSVILLKKIALYAAEKHDTATMDNVRKVLLRLAGTVESKGQEHLKKLIIYALRDIGIKTVQESPDRKKHECLDRVIEALKEIGEVFGDGSIPDVTAALRDIGVVAARKHSDEKISEIIPVMEHFCTIAAQRDLGEQASHAVHAILDVCEISIREQMVGSTASSSKSLANLSNIESISVIVSEAVFEIGKYREIDREMFALFDKTYRKSGGR
ncbi:hypothetical protein [Methanolobus psychrotolerans]|uniref:hypothetical protein n=1 Tax=Methanolobus psychrotolerans TaxID=1874706 RepID=UPI00101AD1EF|nr:hypothetical protein [Methanolobus psychrotolerans]